MVRLKIQHLTIYRYASKVSLGPHRLLLRPCETRDLKLISFNIEMSPQAKIIWSHDVSGNSIANAEISLLTDYLSIHSHSIIELTAATWPVFEIAASAMNYPFLYSDNDWADLGALLHPQFEDPENQLANWIEGFIMQRPTDTLSLLMDISNGISSQISYKSREAEGTQDPTETLNNASGSCRDFAVFFAEAARTLGFGARIVSGYLYNPDESYIGSAGSGATHAWVEIYVPGAGWIPFDPTNRTVGSSNLIAVAVGRDIRQIAPVTGSFHGTDRDFIDMSVKVTVEKETEDALRP
ncbi:transglutaminase family protein [uncultured Cohaesibacter sp.]|uniref:transglutaminase family protein n=1 Tax=uncultured Cohaesibacter sp. TaxID=1002546 RepID=UPI00292F7806|nr:transglutaminase family protein [uncultured Cohaesibacter sp.]